MNQFAYQNLSKLLFVAIVLPAVLLTSCRRSGLPENADMAIEQSATSSLRHPADEEPAANEPASLPAASVAAQPVATPPKQRVIATPTAEQIARWTPEPFEPLQLLAVREWEKTSFTSRLAPIADGKHFLAAGSRVLLWSLTEDEPDHVFLELTSADGERNVAALDVAPDGKWFAVGDSNGFVRVWSLEDHREIASKQLLDNDVVDLAISPDSLEIAAITYDHMVFTWDAATLEPKRKFEVDTNSLKRIVYAAPGLLAVSGESTSLWNTGTGKLVQQLSPGRYNETLARSPDGLHLLFGSEDSLNLWNVAESKLEWEIKHGVSGSERVAFSPDGNFLATSDGIGVKLWNLAEKRSVQIIDGFGWVIVGLSWLPETNLLVVASDIGITRLWGTPEQAASVGLKPLHGPVAMPDASEKAPATHSQIEQAIDLRTLPRLPGNESTMLSRDYLSYEAPAKADEVQIFYRHFLEQSGWKRSDQPPSTPTTLDYLKDGFNLSVDSYDAGDGKTTVMLRVGNYDIRWAPKFDASPIETSYESASTVHYRTKADLLQIETNLLRKLHADGWTPYSRLHTSHSEVPDSRDMEFIKNGATLRVSIGKFPIAPDQYTIQYSLFPNNSWVPVPPDAGFVEFDGSTKPSLVAVTKMSLAETQKFYDAQMAALGWLVRSKDSELKKDHGWLTYVRNQCDLTVGLTKLPDGRSLVQVGDTTGSLWEIANPKEESKDGGTETTTGLEAADFPILNASKTATYDSLGKSIEVPLDVPTLAEAATQYIAALESIGWIAQKGGIRDEEYTLIDFAKDDQEFSFRGRIKDGKAVVSFAGDGLLWNSPLPVAKQVVSYETWLRQNKLPASLDLLDRYQSEMRAIATPSANAD